VIAVKVLNESLKKSQGIGLFVGLAGVLLVLQPALSDSGGLTIEALALLVLALVGSTSATLMQKKLGDQTPLLAGTTYQFFAAGTLLFLFSLISGERSVDWNLESIMAMSWAVLVTSIIAILLLLWMLQKGSAAKISSLLYLVPPMTAIQALLLFGEKLNPQSIIGIVMTALGVALVQKR
jgi:drug/metabolite transporter (DMT)-like permease